MTTTLMTSCVVAAVVSLVVGVCAADYECFPNGTAVIANPDTDLYTFAQVWTNIATCTTSWIANDSATKAFVRISGCAMDVQMDVIFSSRELGTAVSIIGGDDVFAFSFTCNDIPVSGVQRTFQQGLTNIIATMPLATVSPTFTLKSALRLGSEEGAEMTSAYVGQALYWTIDVPEQYTAIPTSCTAYAGTSTSGSPSKQLVSDGCTLDTGLMQSFSETNTAIVLQDKRYFALLWAFKFRESDDVLFHCDVMFCPPGTANCDYVPCTKRKRRSTPEYQAGVQRASVSRVLRVTEVASTVDIFNSAFSLDSDIVSTLTYTAVIVTCMHYLIKL